MSQRGTTKMLIVLFCAAFIAAFNENIINVGLTDIMAEFGVTANLANWLVTGYMITTGIVVTTVAFLLKRIKLRTLFFMGSGVFVLGSALAFIAPTFPLLLVCRLLQAVGTGIFIPTMMNTVLTVAPRKQLGVYLAIGSCCITFGPAFGPVVSGAMVTFFGWRTMFLAPMVLMALILIAGVFLVQNVNKTEKVSLDVPSLIMSILGLTALVYGLSEVMSDIVTALVALAIGLLIIGVFVVRQGKIENPLLNLAPMRYPRFSVACFLVIVAMMTTFSMSVLLPLYFTGATGQNALVAGALVLIPILAQAATAVIGGKVMDKKGEWPLLPVGFLLVTIGQAVVCLVAGSMDLVLVVIGATVVYAGVGLAFSPSQTAGLKELSPEMNSHGVGIMSTFIQIAAALGPSLFVGVLSSTVAEQSALNVSAASAQAAGFSSAVLVAAVIAAVGFIVAFVYARKMTGTQVKLQVEEVPVRKVSSEVG